MTKRVLLTVSGAIDPNIEAGIEAGARPRADYIEMAAALDADLLDYSAALAQASFVGRFIGRLAGRDVLLAWTCFRRARQYAAIVTDGEQIGLPYAALSHFTRRNRRPQHSMIVHIMSVPKKVLLFRALRLRSAIDRMFVYATAQRAFVIDRLGMNPSLVSLTPFMVDTVFFAVDQVEPSPKRMICAAGLEFRDYDTLVEAVAGLDVEVVIAAASPWSKRTNAISTDAAPGNITVCKLSLFDLRQLYADAMFVVMPLHDVEFQAGITTILEAMSMGKAVICSRTVGQTDTVEDEQTGLYVPPHDVEALRRAIVRLIDDPALAVRLGQRGREWAVGNADVERYADRIAVQVQQDMARAH